jgi:hypothetical protein
VIFTSQGHNRIQFFVMFALPRYNNKVFLLEAFFGNFNSSFCHQIFHLFATFMDPEPKDYFCVSWNADLGPCSFGLFHPTGDSFVVENFFSWFQVKLKG